MSKTDHWMPLYIGDYLADTMHLSGPEHGAYLMLLMHYWRTGPLPNDDKKLAAIARFPARDFKKIAVSVRSFFEVRGEHLHQKRMDAELSRMGLISQKKREAAEARWQSKSSANGGSEPEQSPCTNEADAMHMHSESNATGMLRARASQPHPHSEERKIQPTADAVPASWPDARAELWGVGLPILRGLTGKPEGPSRAMLGKLLKSARDDCPCVLRALREAASLRPMDPVAWLTKAVGQPDDDTRLLIAAGLAPNGHDIEGESTELFRGLLQ